MGIVPPPPKLGEGEQKGVSEGDKVPLALSHSPLPIGKGGYRGDGETRKIRNSPNIFNILILSNPQLRKMS